MKGFVCSLMRSLPTRDKTPEVYFLHKAANKQLRAQHSSDKIFFSSDLASKLHVRSKDRSERDFSSKLVQKGSFLFCFDFPPLWPERAIFLAVLYWEYKICQGGCSPVFGMYQLQLK